jgi:hypothetical protein
VMRPEKWRDSKSRRAEAETSGSSRKNEDGRLNQNNVLDWFQE